MEEAHRAKRNVKKLCLLLIHGLIPRTGDMEGDTWNRDMDERHIRRLKWHHLAVDFALFLPDMSGPFCPFPTGPHQKVPWTCDKFLSFNGPALGQPCFDKIFSTREWVTFGYFKWKLFYLFFPFSFLYCIQIVFKLHWKSYTLEFVMSWYGRWQNLKNLFRVGSSGAIWMSLSLPCNSGLWWMTCYQRKKGISATSKPFCCRTLWEVKWLL